jgi:hypothetical protein
MIPFMTSRACSSCGTTISVADRFCTSCGTEVKNQSDEFDSNSEEDGFFDQFLTRDVDGTEYRWMLNALAQAMKPSGSLTSVTMWLVDLTTGILLLPLIVVSPLVRLVVALIGRATFGLFTIPLDLVWQLHSVLLVSTSILWIKYPLLRPVLLIPGVALATTGTAWVSLTTAIFPTVRAYRLAACDVWPMTDVVARKVVQDRLSGIVP